MSLEPSQPSAHTGSPVLLAINYSHEAAALLVEGRLPIDRLKTPDWLDMVTEAGAFTAVSVHFNLYAGRGDISKTDWEQVDALLEATGTPFVNVHIDPTRKNFPDVPVNSRDDHHILVIQKSLIEDVTIVVDRFGPERVIVENEPFRDRFGDTLRPGVLPDVIQRIVQETGCGFLLDLSHARISACYLGVDEFDYIERLPLIRIREMHFTGLQWVNGVLKDHLPALPGDWAMLAWALERIRRGSWGRPWQVAFEYGGVGEKFNGRRDPQVMLEQIPKLRNMLMSI